MSSTIREGSKQVEYLRTLAKRERPESIADELRELSGLSPSIVKKRISDTDHSGHFSKEALVSILRAYLEAGDHDAANNVFLVLISRVSGAIANRMRRWNSIPATQLEDARQTVILGLYEYIFSLDAGEELWECNFKVCFDTRMSNIFAKMSRRTVTTVSATQPADDENPETLLDVADPAAAADFVELEVREALTYLDRINPLLGKAFYLKFFGELKESEIADMLEVSERTVRNWIGNSRKELLSYYAER